MIQKLFFVISFALFYVITFAQNQQVLYGFDHLPQTLMLNPGAEVPYDKHIGVPLLSNIYLQVGVTNKNVNYNNAYAGTEGKEFKLLSNAYKQGLSNNDVWIANQQLEIFSAGFRLKDESSYLSFGLYQEAKAFSTTPLDVLNLLYKGDDQNRDGIPEYNNIFQFNNVNFVGEFLAVYHVGISKKVNKKLNVGARFKLISGSFNVDVRNSNADYYLTATNTNHHNFTNLDLRVNTSGFLDENGERITTDPLKQFTNLFLFTGSRGVGIDLGLTYHFNDKIFATVSLLDLDYMSNNNNTTSYHFNQDFVLDDTGYFNPPEGKEREYYETTLTDYYDAGFIPIDTLRTKYKTFRTPKLNTSLTYQISKGTSSNQSVFRNVSCYSPNDRGIVESSIGVQTYTDFKPGRILWSVTGFYTRRLAKRLNSKITYTVDGFSQTNIGLGFSTRIKKFNFFAMADNLLALPKIKDSNYQSVQMGMNFIFY